MSLMAEGKRTDAFRAGAGGCAGGGGCLSCRARATGAREALGLEEKTAEEFYEDYRLANKLVDQLTAGADQEVSDSEARVITVEEIETSDAETAAAALAAIQAEGGSFQGRGRGSIPKSLWKRFVFAGARGERPMSRRLLI